MLSDDPFLEGKSISIENPRLPDQVKPEKFLLIPDNIISIVIIYLNLIWSVRNKNKVEIPFKKLIENTKYLITGTGRHKDELWIEHSAYNLRSLFGDLSFIDYQNAIKNIKDLENDRESGIISKLELIKMYLNKIVHSHYKDALIVAKKIILDDVEINSLEDIHELISIDLIYTFFELFKKYSYKDMESE